MILGENMSKVRFRYVIWVLIILMAFAGSVAQNKTVSISGRAIDECGNPIPNAQVSLYYPPCRDCIDHIIPTSESLSDGVFFIDAENISGDGLKLYLREKIPTGFWSPFEHIPYENLPSIPELSGVTVDIPQKEQSVIHVGLGDVVVKTRFSKVVVDLPNLLGDQYVPNKEVMSLLKITLKDENSKIIYQGGLPKAAFDSTYTFVNFVLVKGKWKIEISFARKTMDMKYCFNLNINDLECRKLSLKNNKPIEDFCGSTTIKRGH